MRQIEHASPDPLVLQRETRWVTAAPRRPARVSDSAETPFYKRWDFEPLPGHPYRLFVSYQQLEAMMKDE